MVGPENTLKTSGAFYPSPGRDPIGFRGTPMSYLPIPITYLPLDPYKNSTPFLGSQPLSELDSDHPGRGCHPSFSACSNTPSASSVSQSSPSGSHFTLYLRRPTGRSSSLELRSTRLSLPGGNSTTSPRFSAWLISRKTKFTIRTASRRENLCLPSSFTRYARPRLRGFLSMEVAAFGNLPSSAPDWDSLRV